MKEIKNESLATLSSIEELNDSRATSEQSK